MRIYTAENYDEMSEKAARIIAAQVIVKPECVLGLATGSSPVGTYQRLVERYKAGKLSFAGVTTVNLDEYKGLSGTHDQSYRYFMQHNLFDHVDVRPECTHVPNGLAEDAEAECERYDAFVRSLGCADLQLLGVGRNGHIGFNEPC
ncbi:MAG: glucosamine-6-phosphate deaminase, partial [Pseudoflavonifractor capillosus]